MIRKILAIFLLFVSICYAQEVIVDYDKSLPVLNEELRKLREDSLTLIVDVESEISGVVPLANGGTETALTDPDADKIYYWNDTSGETDWLDLDSNFTISSGTLTFESETVQQYAVGDNEVEIFSSTADDPFTTTSYTTSKEVLLPRGGELRIDYGDQQYNGNQGICTQIFRNDVAVGTEHCETDPVADPNSYSEDIDGWSAGDYLQIKGKRLSTGNGHLTDLKVYSTTVTVETLTVGTPD